MTLNRKPLRTPLADIAVLQREVKALFERLAEFDGLEGAAAGEWCPSVDVFECRGNLTIVVEVPGIAPEALSVVYRDDRLVITGERRDRRPPADSTAFLCVERPQGRFTRTIPLDAAVDVRQAEARLAGGLLTITLPRLKDRRGRETVIPVEREPKR
jgi:HSP20 family protein